MSPRLALAAAGIVLVAAAAMLLPGASAAGCDWTNYGVIDQIGNSTCGAAWKECRNYGVAVQVGDFQCESCSNYGVTIWVGNTCWGDSPVGACVDATCVPPPIWETTR
jgi:hypothetical protein